MTTIKALDYTIHEQILHYKKIVNEVVSKLPRHKSGLSIKSVTYVGARHFDENGFWPHGYLDYSIPETKEDQDKMELEYHKDVNENIEFEHACYMLEIFEVPDEIDPEDVQNYAKYLEVLQGVYLNIQP